MADAPEQPMLMPLTDAGARLIQRGRKGHPANPGSGPAAETCGTCESYCVIQRGHGRGKHRKCARSVAKWTHGSGTDIRKGDPACLWWTAKRAADG